MNMKTFPPSPRHSTDAAQPPWWRIGMVWLVVGGPLAVVVASFITLAIAVSGAEEVLTQPTRVNSADDAARLPAVQGRNHAATPKH
jgi:hypothetical protein